MEYLKGLIFIFIILEIILSVFVTYSYMKPSAEFCLSGNGCDNVKNSEYSKIFGISTPLFGIIAFLMLLALYILAYKKKINYNYFLIASLIGAIFSIYFIVLQVFVINSICSNCMIIDLIAIAIAIIATYLKIKKRR